VKGLWRLVLIGLLLLTAVLFANALRHTAKPRAAVPPVDESLDTQRIAQHLAEAIHFPTVSHQDPKDDVREVYAQLRS
jgi:carboxypeptidase PM20D1